MNKKHRKNLKLHYFFDREADVFYFSQGKPKASAQTVEADDDVLLRLDKSGDITGFTILNFSKRAKNKKLSIELPIQMELTPAK